MLSSVQDIAVILRIYYSVNGPLHDLKFLALAYFVRMLVSSFSVGGQGQRFSRVAYSYRSQSSVRPKTKHVCTR